MENYLGISEKTYQLGKEAEKKIKTIFRAFR